MAVIYVQVTTGRGPPECSIALHHLCERMLRDGPRALLMRSQPQSSIISLNGVDAEEWVRPYIGTILWVCEDPLTPNRRRKNWYLGVKIIVMPKMEDIVIRDEDLQYDAIKASGPGGQNVNKRSTAVRLTHLPTGLSTLSQEERSQKQNKTRALERMRHTLKDRQAVEIAILEKMNWTQHNALERGNPVKTFYGPKFLENDEG